MLDAMKVDVADNPVTVATLLGLTEGSTSMLRATRSEKMLASHRAAALHSIHAGTQASCRLIESP